MARDSKKAAPAAPERGRRNGKASKKHPKANNAGATGKTKGGYSPAKLRQRAQVRAGAA